MQIIVRLQVFQLFNTLRKLQKTKSKTKDTFFHEIYLLSNQVTLYSCGGVSSLMN